MNFSRAVAIALTLSEKMLPYADQIQIAGSIRRARSVVGDIDLVILPKDKAGLKARCAAKWRTIRDGDQNCIYEVPLSDMTVQVDIFFAHPASSDLFTKTPTNFGSLLLCRTGSKEHNIKLVEHAKRLGLRWNPYQGVFDGDQLIASETEESIFEALKLPYVPPEIREVI
jgi:DNA polymerase (family 10)